MNDAIQKRAANIGFMSSFLLHAVVIMAVFLIAGNNIAGSGPERIVSVILDGKGFMMSAGDRDSGSASGGVQKDGGRGISRGTTQKKTEQLNRRPGPPVRKSSEENPIKGPAPAEFPAVKSAVNNKAASPDSSVLTKAGDGVPPGVLSSGPSAAAFPSEDDMPGGLGAHDIVGDLDLTPGRYGNGAGGAGADESGFGSGDGTGSGIYGSGVSTGENGGGSEKGGDGNDAKQARYIKEQFHYIRELIVKNIAYPLMARRMGWKGQVTVSFIINEGGYVEGVRILKGSGHRILDENAVKTIKEIQPFPKPPGKAEIIIPIEYRFG